MKIKYVMVVNVSVVKIPPSDVSSYLERIMNMFTSEWSDSGFSVIILPSHEPSSTVKIYPIE